MARGIYKRGKDKETSKEVITATLRSSLIHSTPFRLLSIFFFVLLITGISYAEPLEFRGFIMGMPKEEVEIKVRQKKIEYHQQSYESIIEILKEEVETKIQQKAIEYYQQQKHSTPSKKELDLACGMRACNYTEIIKDVYVEVYLYYGGNPPKLDKITISFYPHFYTILKNALIEKYGQPHNTKKESLQNRMGAVFENEIAEWKLKEGEIRINKYGGTIERGHVDMCSSEYPERVQQEEKKRKALPGF